MSQRWKIAIAITIGLLGLICIWFVIMHCQPESEVEAYKKSLRARGEKLEIAEVLPTPIPPDQNSADAVQAAFKLLNFGEDVLWTNPPSPMRMVAPGRAMIGWRQPDIRNGSTNTWEDVQLSVTARRPALDLLQQVRDHPAIDFQLNYAEGPSLLLPHLPPLRHCAQSLSVAAMCDLHNSAPGSATANVCTMLALVQGMHDERLLISQLVRMAITQITLGASWELLQSTNLTDVQLAALQRAWERLEFINAAENSMLMERATTEATIKEMRASARTFHSTLGLFGAGAPTAASGAGGSGDWFEDISDWAKSGWDRAKWTGAAFMWQTSWSYSDERRALQGSQLVLEALRTAKTDQFFQPAYTNLLVQLATIQITNTDEGWLGSLDLPDFRWIFSESVGAYSGTVRKTASSEVARRLAITAIVLKRYQLRHGNYPSRLSETTPEFLATVPLDPVDGQPLRYRLNPDGTFLLYSIGDDGVDDGGNPVPSGFVANPNWYWQRGRDWVWPQTATPAEVQDFYEHPPK